MVSATSKGSDQPAHTRSLKSLEYSMIAPLLAEQHLEFQSLKGGCTCWSTLVKIPHCWKSHVMAQIGLITSFQEVKQIPAIVYNLQERSCHMLQPDEIYLPHTSYERPQKNKYCHERLEYPFLGATLKSIRHFI